jgi:hypothetical protein
MISISILFFTSEIVIKIVLLLIAIGVTIHLLMIKTQKPDINENSFS